MTDHTDKEPVDKTENTEAKNLSEENNPVLNTEKDQPDQAKTNSENCSADGIPDTDTKSNTPGQTTANMEVHHHAHHGHHTGKRSRNSYFWEFLMLFLAVLCGSLAEYGLEHKIENDREKVFIKTMISDLEEDTALLGESIIKYKQKGIEIDSLFILLNSANIKTHGSALYFYGRLISRFDFFTSTDRTIEQMKNSGAFRLIRNIDAASGISNYYAEMNGIYLLQSNTNNLAMEYRKEAYMVFDPAVFETMVNDKSQNVILKPAGNPSLISYDKSALVRIGSTLHYIKGLRLVLHDRYIDLQIKATALIKLLKKEYHLE